MAYLDISKLKFPSVNLAPVRGVQSGYTGQVVRPAGNQLATYGGTSGGGAGGNTLGLKTTAALPTAGGYTAPAIGPSGAGAVVAAGPSEADLAYQRWRSAIDQANRLRESGRATFDDLIKSVTGFRDRAKTQFNDAGQQIVNTAGELLGTNARSAEEIAGLGRAQGRAIGLGDSSKFNRQQKVNANLASSQGSVLANRGENERANRGVYDERLGQADAKESEANSYLRNINDSASAVEAGGVDNYGSALDSIINYQRQLAAINPLNAGGLQQYAPNLSSIQNTLSTLLGSQAARPIAGGEMGGNPSLSITDEFRKLLGR